jgi:hypothetical protein
MIRQILLLLQQSLEHGNMFKLTKNHLRTVTGTTANFGDKSFTRVVLLVRKCDSLSMKNPVCGMPLDLQELLPKYLRARKVWAVSLPKMSPILAQNMNLEWWGHIG